jgi:hypothetical protein
MEDPDAVTLENRGEGPQGLVRPYIFGPGQDANRPAEAMAGSGEADPLAGFFTPQTPAADYGRVLRSTGPIGRADQAHARTTRLLADPPTAARPRRHAGGSRPSARPAVRRRSLAAVVAVSAAAVAGIAFLAFPSHPGGTPKAACTTAGCHSASSASGSAKPQTWLAGGAQGTMPTPTSQPATARVISPTQAGNKISKQAFTSTTHAPSPSPTASSPSLLPGSMISIESTSQCCTSFSIAHDEGDDRVVVAPVTSGSSQAARADATWIVHRGLADGACVSLESANAPGRYLWHHNFELFLATNDGSAKFASYATFCSHPGNSGQGYSMYAFNKPSMFIRNFELVAYIASNGGVFSWDSVTSWYHDTTWNFVQPWG